MIEEKALRYISIITFTVGILTYVLLAPTRAITVQGAAKIHPTNKNRSHLMIPISVKEGGDPFLRIKSSSCIFNISVNNRRLTDPTLPYCDSLRGRVFRVDELKQSGEFAVQLEIQSDPNHQTSVSEELSSWTIFTSSFLFLTSIVFGLLTFTGWERLLTLLTHPKVRILYEGIHSATGIILILWLLNFYLHGSPTGISLLVTCALSMYLFWLFRLKKNVINLLEFKDVEKNVLARSLLVFLGVMTFLLVSTISIIRHWDLRSLAFDLGIQENILWNTLNGAPFLSSVMGGLPYLGNHTVFAYVLLLPIYFLFQTTETLLILQAGLVCSTICPLFLVARKMLKSEALAAILSACFLLHPGILGASCNDFHELSLAPPALMWVTYCALFDKRLALACFTLVASSIKEDMSLNLLLLGVGLFVVNVRSKGVYLIICGALSYVTWQLMIIPTFAGYNSSYVWYLSKSIGNIESPLRVLYLLLESPFTIIVPLFDEKRLKFLLQTIGAFLFLPWTSLFGVVVTSYGNALVLLSGHWALYTLGYHYIFPWITLMSIATLFLTSSFRYSRARGTVLILILLAHCFLFFQHGPLYPRESFAIGPSHLKNPFLFVTNARMRDEVTLIGKIIPSNASVVTDEHLVPHFSQRSKIQALHRTPKELIPTFDICIIERKNSTSNCMEYGCSGKEISPKNSGLLVCWGS